MWVARFLYNLNSGDFEFFNNSGILDQSERLASLTNETNDLADYYAW